MRASRAPLKPALLGAPHSARTVYRLPLSHHRGFRPKCQPRLLQRAVRAGAAAWSWSAEPEPGRRTVL